MMVLPLGPLSNLDIADYIKHSPLRQYFQGVYSRDENLPDLRPKSAIIINLDDLDGPGTHWVALCRSGQNYIYFDSYALPPPKELTEKYKPIHYNTTRIQDFNTFYCGHFCLMFCEKLLTNRPSMAKAIQIMSLFDWHKMDNNILAVKKYFDL
jgi:hypothetical protein